MSQIRILLADDHTVMRRGLRLLLESQSGFTVVAEASDGRQAVEQAEATHPDVAVLDIAMPNLSGIEAAQRIAAQSPHTAIVILSMHSDEGYVLRALKAGARGYLLKGVTPEVLVEAIRTVASGGAYLYAPLAAALSAAKSGAEWREDAFEKPDDLTEREMDVLKLMTCGISNREIAKALRLSEGTVRNHVSSIFSKLGVNDRTKAVLYALQKRLV